MAPQILRLPDGQSITVTPVFSGLFFKPNELSAHPHAYPLGWTVVLNTQEGPPPADDKHDGHKRNENGANGLRYGILHTAENAHPHLRPYTKPTLQNDNVFISSISVPSSSESKPPASPTRQIAMMLWITLYWYFHQQEPPPHLTTEASKHTPDEAKPRGDWRINIKRDGVLRSRNIIPKLERMGLIASLDSSPSQAADDDAWDRMFVSKKMFWQIPGRLFLFSLQQKTLGASVPGSPVGSRPGTPLSHLHSPLPHDHPNDSRPEKFGFSVPTTTVMSPSVLPGPFHSSSHLPTYYPPPPLFYTTTNNIRHPLRPKPPRTGEVFYTRFIPSVGQYLSFRVASPSPQAIPYQGPTGPNPPSHPYLLTLSDTELLRSWLSNPRVSKFWGSFTDGFLPTALSSQHSFPAIGMWDGVPFGYFEIYWVKEDALGQKLGNEAGDWDRGLHVIVGEEWARGRVSSWLSSLVHWCLTADYRTMNVCLEPRVDNER